MSEFKFPDGLLGSPSVKIIKNFFKPEVCLVLFNSAAPAFIAAHKFVPTELLEAVIVFMVL